MRALVTGATGFLGGALAHRLHATGWQVRALGRNTAAGAALQAADMEFVQASLEDESATIAACENADVVFHCGALSSPWGRERAFFAANVTGTRNVIAGCEQHHITRLVHVSTPSLYFDFRHRLDLTEASPFAAHPVNAYARTKLTAEQCVDAAVTRGLDAVTLRPRAIFGPGDTTLFPRLLRVAQRGKFPLIGDGDPVMDVTYVGHAVDALIAAATTPDIAGRKYNITNGEPWTRRTLLRELFAQTGQPFTPRIVPLRPALAVARLMEWVSRIFTAGRWEPPLTRYSAAVLAFSQTFDLTAARRDLGCTPVIGVAEGIRHFAEWRRTQP